jgi:hypothetical protein
MNAFSPLHTDVNECAVEIGGKEGGCDHRCVNYAGSYECTCTSGFFLQSDGKSCGRSRPGERASRIRMRGELASLNPIGAIPLIWLG